MNVKVCDSIMGSGKTSAAITQMNEDSKNRYIFITPYLDEVERIKAACPSRDFKDPVNYGHGKLESLHQLLKEKQNIASTHALFKTYNKTTVELIRKGNYKLIMDEVANVFEFVPSTKNDVDMLLSTGVISVARDGRVRWDDEEYHGKFAGLKDIIDSGNVVLHNMWLLVWMFPIDVFEAFKEVVLLTYMFHAQKQKCYFDIHNISAEVIGVRYENGEYRFSNEPNISPIMKELPAKIHILDDDKLNTIGDGFHDLSSTWYHKAKLERGCPKLNRLRKNLANVFRNRYKAKADNLMWTSFVEYKDVVSGGKFGKGFLAANTRALNGYSDRVNLAYCVNIFLNPFEKNYFASHGTIIRENDYALSEMVQWIWRSGIREGKDVWIYIPSSRMRRLLEKWLCDISGEKWVDERDILAGVEDVESEESAKEVPDKIPVKDQRWRGKKILKAKYVR